MQMLVLKLDFTYDITKIIKIQPRWHCKCNNEGLEENKRR